MSKVEESAESNQNLHLAQGREGPFSDLETGTSHVAGTG